MTRGASYAILLAKEDFKFSSAHFTVFDGERAELLHGHNYRVRVRLEGAALSDQGLLVDIEPIKRAIRELCGRLDSRTLVPTENGHLQVMQSPDRVEVRFRGRAYQLPAADVILLPEVNTSIEILARMIWEELASDLQGSPIETLTVAVEETAGQGCRYRAPLAAPRDDRTTGRTVGTVGE